MSEFNRDNSATMSDSEELKPPCDCIEQNSSGAWYVYDCQCTNSGDLIEASSWCGEMNEKAKHNTRPSASKMDATLRQKIGAWIDGLPKDGPMPDNEMQEAIVLLTEVYLSTISTPSASEESQPCGELVEVGKDLTRLRDFAAKNGHNRITISDYQLQTVISALQSSRGVEESWIDELGYYVQYAFDHCDELMEKFYPSIMPDFEFDEFYMSKSLCRLQVTQMHTAVSMSLVISTPDYIEWVQTMEDSNHG